MSVIMTRSTQWSLSPVQNEPEVYFLVVLTLLQSYFVYEGKLANFVYHR